MGILARSLPGNLTIWRKILTFEIKKYIGNSGKSDYLAGKNTLFQAVLGRYSYKCRLASCLQLHVRLDKNNCLVPVPNSPTFLKASARKSKVRSLLWAVIPLIIKIDCKFDLFHLTQVGWANQKCCYCTHWQVSPCVGCQSSKFCTCFTRWQNFFFFFCC